MQCHVGLYLNRDITRKNHVRSSEKLLKSLFPTSCPSPSWWRMQCPSPHCTSPRLLLHSPLHPIINESYWDLPKKTLWRSTRPAASLQTCQHSLSLLSCQTSCLLRWCLKWGQWQCFSKIAIGFSPRNYVWRTAQHHHQTMSNMTQKMYNSTNSNVHKTWVS